MKTIPKSIDDLLMYRIASMYYKDDLSQAQIARRIGLSRPQISRYLKRARETGMVEININDPYAEESEEISKRIKSLLGLKDAVVTPLERSKNDDEEKIFDSIAAKARSYLPQIISRSKTVGVGWGRTLYRTIIAMDHFSRESDIVFVPLTGAIGQTVPFYQVNSMVDRLAEKFGAGRVFLNIPAFANAGELYRSAILSCPSDSVGDYWSKLDLAIIGLGGPKGTLSAEIEPSIVARLREQGAVGDILGQFFKSDGEICVSGMEDNLAGIPIGKLREVENVVCLSGGIEKVEGIIAAARARYFNILITDEKTAGCILKTLEDDL